MLFNSNIFIFVFLPITLLGFFTLKRFSGPVAAQLWLTAASIIFYGWSGLRFLPVLFLSIAVNYMTGRALGMRAYTGAPRRPLLAAGIAFDLLLLAYFKYAGFLGENLHSLTGISLNLGDIELPVGISFYTFTQIAFLVDAAKSHAKEYDIPRYALFVTFFPHLIAGPIIHHKEMMPQFAPDQMREGKFKYFPLAMTLFAIGLFKKVALADTFATFASPVFNAAAGGAHADLIGGWQAALSYTFQIYFDFSGYSDMALGLALMFGIRLPVNFLSPYQSTTIIDFWRRWHITLSRFLRDYLYFPLGGNRQGKARRYVNLLTVMLIGGLWHGAGWTFVLWGGLHGFYLVVNHFWEFLQTKGKAFKLPRIAARLITFFGVLLAWVLFRAANMDAAGSIYASMMGFHGAQVPVEILSALHIHHSIAFIGLQITPLVSGEMTQLQAALMCMLGFVIVWAFPNSMLIARMAALKVADGDKQWWQRLQWRPILPYALVTGAVLFFSIRIINSGAVSEFIYFQF